MEQETEDIQLLFFDDLVRIFEYLELKDQLNVALTCQNFYDIIVNSIWRRRYTDIRIQHSLEGVTAAGIPADVLQANLQIKQLSKEDYKKFFRMNLPNLRKLRIADLTAQYWKYFLGHNLARPDIDYYLTFNYPQLKELACVNLSTIFHDGTMRHMAVHCANVERLTVSSRNVTGRYLCNFQNLRNLSLANCALEVCHLKELLEKTKTLQFLDVRGNWELAHKVVPTWGESLKEIQLDEAAFLQQFTSAHELPKGLKNIRKFKIACRRENEIENQNESESNKSTIYVSFLLKFAPHMRQLKIMGQSAAFYTAMQRIQISKIAQKFAQLSILHFRNDSLGMQCLETFKQCRNLTALHIYQSEEKVQYELREVFDLLQNNAQLNFISLELGNHNEEIALRFLDDVISFQKQWAAATKLNLSVELLKVYENFSFNYIERQCENLRNFYELREIRKSLFVLQKPEISFDFGLKLKLKTKLTAKNVSAEAESIEIELFEGDFPEATYFKDTENFWLGQNIDFKNIVIV